MTNSNMTMRDVMVRVELENDVPDNAFEDLVNQALQSVAQQSGSPIGQTFTITLPIPTPPNVSYDEPSGAVTMDEFALHDMLCGMNQNISPLDVHTDGGMMERIKIVPKNPKDFPKHLVDKYEALMNGLIVQMYTMDGMLHQDAEYTC